MEVICIIDDNSLKVIDKDVEKIEHEIGNLRVAVLQMLYLETIYAQEARFKDMLIN